MKKGELRINLNPERDTDDSDQLRKNLINLKPLVKTLRDPKWLCTISLAIVFGFFGVNFQTLRNWVFPPFVDATTPPAPEHKTIDYSLENRASVVDKGGEVHGGDFDEGGCNTNGFISIDNGDVVFLPIPPGFTSLYEGAVALCLTPTEPFKDSVSLFRVHEADKTEPNISLKVVPPPDEKTGGPKLRLRLRGHKRTEKVEVRDPFDWQTDNHYHVTGTWGAAGMKLYVNGKFIRKTERVIRGDVIKSPVNFEGGKLVVNNEKESEGWNHPTNCIISNLQVSNYQLSDKEVAENYSKLHPEK